MAQPKVIRGSKFLIMLGNGAGTEVFAAPCALNSKGINLSADTNDTNIPDCDTPDAATWTGRVISALSAGVSGSGTLALESLATWRTWFLSAASKNIRVKVDVPLADGGGHFAMAAVLTSFNLGANQSEYATIEIEIQSDGGVTWVPASA